MSPVWGEARVNFTEAPGLKSNYLAHLFMSGAFI